MKLNGSTELSTEPVSPRNTVSPTSLPRAGTVLLLQFPSAFKFRLQICIRDISPVLVQHQSNFPGRALLLREVVRVWFRLALENVLWGEGLLLNSPLDRFLYQRGRENWSSNLQRLANVLRARVFSSYEKINFSVFSTTGRIWVKIPYNLTMSSVQLIRPENIFLSLFSYFHLDTWPNILCEREVHSFILSSNKQYSSIYYSGGYLGDTVMHWYHSCPGGAPSQVQGKCRKAIRCKILLNCWEVQHYL